MSDWRRIDRLASSPVVTTDKPFTLVAYRAGILHTASNEAVSMWLEENAAAMSRMYPMPAPFPWYTRILWKVRNGAGQALRWIACKIDGERSMDDDCY